MEPKHTSACPQWAARIAEWTGGNLSSKQRAQVAAHLQTCAGCARMAEELSLLNRALSALPPRPLSPYFDARLAARLASVDAQGKQTRWAGLRQPWPRLARPTLALGAMTLIAVGAAFFEHIPPAIIPNPPSGMATDLALVSHCVEQHRTEAAAQPLSDLSAQNLAAQVDGTAPADANAGTANEDGL